MKKHEKLRHALDIQASFLSNAAAAYCKEQMTALTLDAAGGDNVAAYLLRADRDCTAAFRVLLSVPVPSAEHARLWRWWNISEYIESDAAIEYSVMRRAKVLAATMATTSSSVASLHARIASYLIVLGDYWKALPRKERQHWDKDLMTPGTMMVPWKGSR